MKLVSIITPCYNTAAIVHRLLDSILMQSYPLVELILVDDGSKDNIVEVIESYRPKFNKKGYSMTLLQQENSGQSVAINRALKHVKGDYLLWPDSDDYYDSELFIEKMVSALEAAPANVGSVKCFAYWRDEESLSKVDNYSIDNYPKEPVNLFEDALFDQNGFSYAPLAYMVKVSALDTTIPNREIYTEKNAGQNWQLMLPIFYSYNTIYLHEFLCSILVRSQSHSRGQYADYNGTKRKVSSYRNTIIETLKKIKFTAPHIQQYYIDRITCKYIAILLGEAYLHSKQEDLNSLYDEVRSYMRQDKKIESTLSLYNRFMWLPRYMKKSAGRKIGRRLKSIMLSSSTANTK